MKEDFLHYVWKYQKLSNSVLQTVCGQTVSVVHPGMHNFNAGPDFLNAQLVLNHQLWAGNVEIHIKSSDWYAHKHQDDDAYNSVLLHVVWEYNVAVFRENDEVIPTIVLKDMVLPSAIAGYTNLLHKNTHFINCEEHIASVAGFTTRNWLERLYIERLEQKTKALQKDMEATKNHWELLLFKQLFAAFGLKVNSTSFASIAHSFPFSVVQKCKGNTQALEALFFGQAGLLDKDLKDTYGMQLQQEYAYLKQKFKLTNNSVIAPKFFRLRPSSFPSIRLSQLAVLFTNSDYLFSKVSSVVTKEAYYRIFDITATSYWNTHYNFDVLSSEKEKKLTQSFIDLLILNAVIPVAFYFATSNGKEISEDIIRLAATIAVEKNSIVQKFNALTPMAQNAMQSQALLQLNNNYCHVNRCLECAIGHAVLHTK